MINFTGVLNFSVTLFYFLLIKEQEQEDLDLLNAPQMEKPKKPTTIDKEDIRQKVVDLYGKIRRLPGDKYS